MSTLDSDASSASRARYPFAALRRMLLDARSASDAARINAALIDVIDGLLAHTERQARAVEDLRSDLDHKQGIVTKIDGGPFVAPTSIDQLREFASSANGDHWFLGSDEASGIPHVVHKANVPSGGAITRIPIGSFLNQNPSAPETLGLLQMIGSLVR